MESNTINYLNSTVWYRFVKVIFVVALLIAISIFSIEVITGTYGGNWTWEKGIMLLVGGNLAILLIFEAIRRGFYYIALGTVRPKD